MRAVEGLSKTISRLSGNTRASNAPEDGADNDLRRIVTAPVPDLQELAFPVTDTEKDGVEDVESPWSSGSSHEGFPGPDWDRQSKEAGMEKDWRPDLEDELKREMSRASQATLTSQRSRPNPARSIFDAEAGMPIRVISKVHDPNLVDFDGEDDPANPKNWSFKKRWAVTAVVSSFTFISPVTSSIVAPALPAIAKEFNITTDYEEAMVLSIFVLGYAVGPLFLGPLSEVYGRVIILQLTNIFYFIWNLACGFSQSKAQIIVFRFFAGIGGSACIAIGYGVLGDCWRAHERGRAMSLYNLMPLLGPAVGPLVGGFIVEHTTWRWCFWSTCAFCGLLQISGILWLRETWAPTILAAKAKRLRKETGNPDLHTALEGRKLTTVLRVNMVRPFRMLFSQPIIQVLALYLAYVYGLNYLVLSTFATLWTTKYHERIDIAGLNYITIGIALFLGMQICAPLVDVVYRRLQKTHGEPRPEFRIPLLLPGSLLVSIGIFWYGWSAQAKTHWIMPNLGIAIYSIGGSIGWAAVQTYLVDAYTTYAASAVAATAFLRCLAGFGFPLFAPYMYNALGWGWGNTIIGIISIAIGIPAPIFLWVYGQRLRAKSPYAAG